MLIRFTTMLTVLASLSLPSQAQFLEEFDGGFESFWGTYPFASGGGFQGFPDHTFENIGGADVIRLNTWLGHDEYAGMSPKGVLVYDDFGYFEVRYQLLSTNASNSGTDMPLQIGLVSEGGGYVSVGITDGQPTGRRIRMQNHVGPEQLWIMPTQDDTWYRLRIVNNGDHLSAILLEDDGVTEMFHGNYPVDMTDVQTGGLGLHVIITQRIIDLTHQIRNCDVALDHAEVTLYDCLADINGDHVLDLVDVSQFIAAFMDQHPTADLNEDGVIDLTDINLFVQLFTGSCA